MQGSSAGDVVWTVGHSSRTIEQLIELLNAHSIELVADVRRFAGSRKHPHFNVEALSAALAEQGIEYASFPELGGRRKARPDSPHTVWRHAGFRGYADHMESAEFRAGFERLKQIAEQHRTAMLCSEAVWWRCHRSMIADALKVEGVRVLHIMATDRASEHPYTSAASVIDGRLFYGAGSTPASQ